MGGYGSGRQYGRPTADASLFVDIAWMVRTKRAVPGANSSGSLSWTRRGEPSGNISYTCDMRDLDAAMLELKFKVTPRTTGKATDHHQKIPLSYTVPHYGGKRWWMHCPVNQMRVGKLYVPTGGDIFASRKAWRLGYHSQRISDRERPFEALNRLQKRLGCEQGWGNYIRRPKGMHHRTFDRLLDEYDHLDGLCGLEMMSTIGLLKGRL